MNSINAYGGLAFVARSVDDVRDALLKYRRGDESSVFGKGQDYEKR